MLFKKKFFLDFQVFQNKAIVCVLGVMFIHTHKYTEQAPEMISEIYISTLN